jgi:hypothetical protein
MGGEHQDTIEIGKEDLSGVLDPGGAPEPSHAIPKVSGLSQKIRYHLSQGKIHFHLDDENLKVEIPVADWWGAWQELKNLRRNSWQYVDHQRGTMLEVTAGIGHDGKFDICPVLTKIAQGSGAVFDKLDEFTTKCRSG